MQVIIHKNEVVVNVFSPESNQFEPFKEKNCVKLMQELANKYPDEVIGWCEEEFFNNLLFPNWGEIFHHELIMASYSVSGKFTISSAIGYVEHSPFLKINFHQTFPTWLMSTDVGGIHAKALKGIDDDFFKIQDFSFFLNSVSKLGQKNKLFCYSEPRLLKVNSDLSFVFPVRDSNYLFQFVKQNYRLQWLFVLFFNFLIYEKKFHIVSFFRSLFFQSQRKLYLQFDSFKVIPKRKKEISGTLDVIIPTLGRKNSLYDVLSDFRNQTLLPSSIFIVEQNPLMGSKTELDYLYNENWPFEIKHHFTYQTGACLARNWALDQIESEWVFLSDDDIRLEFDFVERAFEAMSTYNAFCSTFSCVSNFGEGLRNEKVNQSTVFGSGNSIIKVDKLKDLRFSLELEAGYGEDMDFGMKLRNEGVDVIHFPAPQIQHLKAPVGGFRSHVKLNSQTVLNPSPTVLWSKIKHATKEEFLGYKTFYFLSQFRNGNLNYWKIKNQWDRSLEVANSL